MSIPFSLEDLLQVLIALEQNGAAIYSQLSKDAKDIETMKLFAHLSEQEKQHQLLYESWSEAHFDSQPIDAEYAQYLTVLVKETFKVLETVGTASLDYHAGLALAKTLEKDTLLFLSECNRLVSGNNKAQIEQIKDEERRHLKLLYELG